MWERLRSRVFGEQPGESAGSPPEPNPPPSAPKPMPPDPVTRHSKAVEQFFGEYRGLIGQSILDLGGVSQENIAYITARGHRLHSHDYLAALQVHFAEGDFFANQARAEVLNRFLSEMFPYEDRYFDGILAWDFLEFLTPALLERTINEMYRVLRPGGCILAVFHTNEKLESIPVFHYRLQEVSDLQLTFRAYCPPANVFNNRAIERIFARFSSVKFFLTREQLREVLARR